jgi:DNA ligase (NAD+)
VEELVNLIEYHNNRYWKEGNPEISDEEYDLLTRQLEIKDPFNPLLEKIAFPRFNRAEKIRHAVPMLSLEKAYSRGGVVQWAEKFARTEDELFSIQPKYDGISANFANGVLASRGDGFEGENISDKIPLIELEADGYKGPLNRDARGEIIIRNDDFKNIYSKILKKDGALYKNQRNAVAGIMGLKKIDEMLSQGAKLTLVDYGMIKEILPFSKLKDENSWNDILKEFSILPYPMDGVVVKFHDDAYSASLGATAHHPRGQIAFKISGLRMPSVIKNVEWSFGKNCLTPIAMIDPVRIGGITIKKVTLHNLKFVNDNDLRIGDKVIVERAGDVIPHIVSSEKGAERTSFIIEKCPSCGSALVIEGPELKCVNQECPDTKLRRLLSAVRSIGIERLGEPTLKKMMSALSVKKLKDIFSLTKEDFLALEGFREKSADNLFREIQSARKTSDRALLASLNIEGVGKNIAKSILEKYSLGELRKMSAAELENISGIGPERSKGLSKELERQSEIIAELLDALDVSVTKTSDASENLKTICFTGKMPEKRSHYERLAGTAGYKPVDSVTEKLSLLVVADINENSSKMEKAKKYGVKIIPLSEWLVND